MAAMARTILYADPKTDITNAVTQYLNENYKRMGGVAPKPAPVAPASAPARTSNPAGRTATPGVLGGN